MGVRLPEKFLLVLVDTASNNLNQATLAQITPAQLMRKAATVRNTQVTSGGKTPMELAKRSPGPSFHESRARYIQKLAMRTHLEVQQREDIRRDLAERMKFVPPVLRTCLPHSFKKRTTHLDFPGNFVTFYQAVVKTCLLCNSVIPRPERSRVSGLRAEEFGDLIFVDSVGKDWRHNFRISDCFG